MASAPLDCAAAFVSALPQGLAVRVLVLVPADARARCACVCRAWRAALADPAAWARLDLTRSGGVHWSRGRSDAALAAAAARAHGRLALLDVRGCGRLSDAALRAVLAANAAALSELRLSAWMLRPHQREEDEQQLLDVRRLAPALRTLVVQPEAGEGDREDAEDEEESPHETSLSLDEVEALLRSDEDGCATLATLEADVCASLSQAPALLRGQAEPFRGGRLVLRRLTLVHDVHAMFAALGFAPEALPPPSPPPQLRELGAALRASTLSGLCVTTLARGEPRLDALRALLDAASGHATLTWLQLALPHEGPSNVIANDGTHGVGMPPWLAAALGELLRADAPALRTLRLRGVSFRDADYAPLLSGLSANRRLETLDTGCVNSLSADFVEAQLLPALRANAGLRRLRLGVAAAGATEAVETAEDVVSERPQRHSAEAAALEASLMDQKFEAFSSFPMFA